MAAPTEIFDDKRGADHSDCFYEWIRDVVKTQVASDGFLLKEASQRQHHSGDAHLLGNKILQVGSNKGEAPKDGVGFEFDGGADFLIGGWGKSVGTADTDSVNDKGLAVLAVNGSKGIVADTTGDFYGVGYGLISTSKFTIKNRTVQTALNAYANSNAGNPDGTGADVAFLVFQNQNNSKDAFYSIENLPNQLISKGIYVDTTDLEFSLTQTESKLTSDSELQINLGDKHFIQNEGSVKATGTLFLTKTEDGQYQQNGGTIEAANASFDSAVLLGSGVNLTVSDTLELKNSSLIGGTNSGNPVKIAAKVIKMTDNSTIGGASNVAVSGVKGISISGGSIKVGDGKEVSITSSIGNITLNQTTIASTTEGATKVNVKIGSSESENGTVSITGYGKDKKLISFNSIDVGNGNGRVSLKEAYFYSHGNGVGGGYGVSVHAGKDGLALENTKISYSDGEGGETNLLSKGDIKLINSEVNDNTTESGTGKLSVQSEKDGANITLVNSVLDDDTINLGQRQNAHIALSQGSMLHPDSDGDGVFVYGKTVKMTEASHIGKTDNGRPDGETSPTGKVQIHTESLELTDNSYITTSYSDEVNPGIIISNPYGGINVTMDEDSWIKGKKVSVTGTGVGITGGSITTTGEENSEINVSGGNKGINIVGPSIDAGKGTVNIGTNDNPADSGNITITGKEPNKGIGITGGNINIGTGIGGGTGVVVIEDTQIGIDPESPDGKITIHTGTGTGSITGTGITGPSIDIGVGPGGTLGITGTEITGDKIDFKGEPVDPNKEPGKVIIEDGSSVIAGDEDNNPDKGTGGSIGIGTGVEVIVGQGGTLTANKGTDDPDTGTGGGVIDVTGGKLTIEGDGFVETEDDVNVNGGGSIDFTAPVDPDTNPGKLVVGGNLNVGGDTDGDGTDDGKGTIHVDEGNTGIIVVEKVDPDIDGKVTVGTGGLISVGTGGTLIVGDEKWVDPNLPEVPGTGLVVDDIEINVDKGTIQVDKITGTGGDDGGKVIVGGGSYIDIDDPFNEKGEVSFDLDEDAEDVTIEVGDISDENLDKLTEEIGKGGKVTGIVVGGVTGMDDDHYTLEEWDKEIGPGNVIAGQGVDISQDGTYDKDGKTNTRNPDEIGHGGGSFLVGTGTGPITITGPEDDPDVDTGKVTITGAQNEVDRDENGDGFDVLRPKDPTVKPSEDFGGLVLEDQTQLVLGNGSSWGGNIVGDITAKDSGETEGDASTTDPKVNVIGGHWEIGGGIDLGQGNLIIEDRFDQNGSGDAIVSVDKSVNTGNLIMTGDKTGLNVGEDLTVNKDANLTGGSKTDESGAHVHVGGDFKVTGNLTMSGNSNVNVDKDTTVDGTGGMKVEEGSSFNGKGNLTVTGGDSIFDGTVNVGGDYVNNQRTTEITGNTHVTGTTTTKDLVVGESGLTGSDSNGTFIADKEVNVEGNFTSNTNSTTQIGGEFTVTGSSQIAGNVTVDDKATFTGGLHMTEGGSFTNTSDKGTTVDNYLILDKGSKLDAGSKFELADNQVSIGAEVDGKGTINGWIGAGTIDLSKANTEVTFTGEGAGSNSHHLMAGANGITYENGGTHVFDRIDDHDDGGEVTGTVNIGLGGSMTMDANKTGSEDKAFLHMNDTLTLKGDDSTKVIVGDVGNQDTSKKGIYLGKDALFDLSTEGFEAGDSILNPADSKIYVSGDADIYISDWTLGTEGTLKVDFDAFDGLNIDEIIANKLTSDSVLESFWYDDGKSELGMNMKSASDIEGTDDQMGGVVDAVLGNKGENSRKQELVNEVFSKTSGFMTQDANGNWVVSNRGNQRLEEVLGLPIAAGAFNIAYDAMNQMGNSVGNRMLEGDTTKSTSVWADVLATRNSAKELFGNSGYSADIYAGVLGTDTWVTPKTLVGAAITMGTADGEGEGATMRIDNDAKFYGAFAYTSHTPAENVTLSADIGFMNVENDIATDVNFGGEGDTKVITVGGRIDMTMYRSDRMTVTPHFGLRYANFSIDSMNQTATNDINVLEAPMGVTVKGKTQLKGWNVTPNVDFTLVPQFGDKKAKIWNSGVAFKQDVLDPALVNTSIGITGQKGNTTFGVNYRLGVGGDERQNHSFMGNIRYQF